MIYKKICEHCKKEFETHYKNKYYCSKECLKISNSHKKYSSNTEYVECKICGYREQNLIKHIPAEHNISIKEYCNKFLLEKKDLLTKTVSNIISNGQKKSKRKHGFTSINNPSYSIECKKGRNSPFSRNFKGYDGLSEEEVDIKIKEIVQKVKAKKIINHSNTTTLEYWLSKGYNTKQALKKLSDRQQTFTLQKCIAKYGKKEGIKKWNLRQQKWITNFKKSTYSKISQELFWDIYSHIKNNFKEIYFATIKNNEKNTYHNNEYIIKINDIAFKIDFFIKDINLCIEFDGNYWHSKNKNIIKRDKKKEKYLKENNFKLLRIKESAYLKNKKETLIHCLNFIKDNTNE